MALPALDNLVRIGQLKSEPPSRSEIEGLIRSGVLRIRDAEVEVLSLDGRFDLAYNAVHSLSLAALRWHGYRSDSRYLVFQCLKHTIGLPPEQWRVLDQAHRDRNRAEYEGAFDMNAALLAALIRVAQEVLRRVVGLGEFAAQEKG